jgi:DNA polymerase
MHTLNIDIETYSSADLKSSGVYKYVESPDFTILLIGYAFDGEAVQLLDCINASHLEEYQHLCDALVDPECLKTAHNASFERTCLAKFFGIELPPEQWQCTMVKAAMLGLPLSLDGVSTVLRLAERKDSEGKALIKYFCQPCKPSKVNEQRTRNLPHHDPAKWEKFKEYCRQDVVVEKAILDKISWFTVPAAEQTLWCLDQRINDRGVMLDLDLIRSAITIADDYTERLTTEAIELTGLNNPNSGAQLKQWLGAEMGEEVKTLRKGDLVTLSASDAASDSIAVARVLEIRGEMAKTSLKKYPAMLKCLCADHRTRGIFQFYGANRTGRWAGRLSQPQNLPRISLADSCLGTARELVKNGGTELLEMMYGNVPDTLSQLLRTTFIAKEGHRFIVADFASIEARVIAWLAGEQWRLDVFNTHGKIYEASAAAMFKVPLEDVTKEMRQRGKVAELALGYQGGPNALEQMDIKGAIPKDELQPIVTAWRAASPKIVKMWYAFNEAAISAVETGSPYAVQGISAPVKFYTKKGVLFMELPSGRALAYMRPKLKPGKFGGDALAYEGVIQKINKWGTIDTYGGSLVENAVQAIARDCLAAAMLAVQAEGYDIAMHIHDELVIEAPDNLGSLAEVTEIMTRQLPWTKGLPLGADGFDGKYYKK